MGRRSSWTAALVALLMTFALALTYAHRALLRAGPFTDRAIAALSDEAVQAAAADHLTSAIIRAGNGNLDAVRPLIRPVAGAVVGTRAFAALLRRGLRDAHHAIVSEGGGTVFVNIADTGVLVGGVLTRVAPAAARRIKAERVVTLLTLHPSGFLRAVVHTLRRLYVAGWVCAALATLLALVLLWRTDDRRIAARRLGIGLLGSGVVLATAYVIGGALAGQLAPAGRGAAARALWGGFLHGLLVEALLVAGAGAAVAALAERPAPRSDAATALTDARALLSGRTLSSHRQWVLSVGLLIAGLVILLEPSATLSLAAIGVGLFVLARGVQGLGHAANHAWAAVRGAPASGARRARGSAGPLIGVALAAAVIAVALTGVADEPPAVAATSCNGSVTLCERPLSDVALAATHNSMASVTIPTWLFGQQDGTIADQLNVGIRGLLIDSYYGEAVGGRVRTDLESLPKREAAVEELGAPAVDAALRIRDRLARKGAGKRGIFLCHGFCELGAITLDSALRDLRSFLVSHPGAVVEIINQDEGVTPQDIARAFERAGLLDLVYRGPLGPFPTLRTMIDSGQRLVVMAENDAGSVPWYHLAYEHALQETPFRFTRASQLTDPANVAASCQANRGPESAPLFLLNNWVDTTPVPRASLAELVNARGVLLHRARECQRIRRRLPNLVAVDFFRRGDVLGVVNALNGVTH